MARLPRSNTESFSFDLSLFNLIREVKIATSTLYAFFIITFKTYSQRLQHTVKGLLKPSSPQFPSHDALKNGLWANRVGNPMEANLLIYKLLETYVLRD